MATAYHLGLSIHSGTSKLRPVLTWDQQAGEEAHRSFSEIWMRSTFCKDKIAFSGFMAKPPADYICTNPRTPNVRVQYAPPNTETFSVLTMCVQIL